MCILWWRFLIGYGILTLIQILLYTLLCDVKGLTYNLCNWWRIYTLLVVQRGVPKMAEFIRTRWHPSHVRILTKKC